MNTYTKLDLLKFASLVTLNPNEDKLKLLNAYTSRRKVIKWRSNRTEGLSECCNAFTAEYSNTKPICQKCFKHC